MLQCLNAEMLECVKSNQPAGRQGFSGANTSKISNLKSEI
jgi:hypothetical protein